MSVMHKRGQVACRTSASILPNQTAQTAGYFSYMENNDP